MMIRKSAAAVAVGLALLVAPGVAQANAQESETVSTAGYDCVTGDDVRYRSGPGTGYPAYGQAQKRQGVVKNYSKYGNNPVDGKKWWNVDLWGGRKNVWIRGDLLGWCS